MVVEGGHVTLWGTTVVFLVSNFLWSWKDYEEHGKGEGAGI